MQVRLASVRRSLFSHEAERSKFLNHLVTGTRDILRAQTGLNEHSNYHEFCRLLGRLKTNYQLNELVWFCSYVFRVAGMLPRVNEPSGFIWQCKRCSKVSVHAAHLL